MHELETLLGRLKMEHLGLPRRKPAGAGGQKRTELPRVPVHGVAAGMEWEASAQYGVPAKQARFPWVNALEQFDFGSSAINCKVVRELAGLVFVERSENVILVVRLVWKPSWEPLSWVSGGRLLIGRCSCHLHKLIATP